MKIVTIIVTYNPMKWIDKCMSCLKESTISTEVVIIDNCSTDGAREYIPKAFPHIVWMPQSKNLGFGQGNNLGMRYAISERADYVLLLNQDAYLQPKALELMLEVSDGTNLLSPMHLNGNGTCIDRMVRWSLMKTIDAEIRSDICGEPTIGTGSSMLIDDFFFNNHKQCYEITEICAACWFMPRKLLETIGGFNPLFFHYSEDNNYYHRMLYHGIKTILVPDAHVWHDRNLYGNVQTFNQNRLHRDVILNFCDINKSMFKGWCKFIRILLRSYVYDIRRGEYKVGAWMKELLWTLGHYRLLLHSRQQERKLASSWL